MGYDQNQNFTVDVDMSDTFYAKSFSISFFFYEKSSMKMTL